MGAALAETAETPVPSETEGPSQASGGQDFAHPVLIGVTLAEIAEIAGIAWQAFVAAALGRRLLFKLACHYRKCRKFPLDCIAAALC
jgi:hypothetical protein